MKKFIVISKCTGVQYSLEAMSKKEAVIEFSKLKNMPIWFVKKYFKIKKVR